MIKYKSKAYSNKKYIQQKWRTIKHGQFIDKHVFDFNKYIYKISHKTYSSHSQELTNVYNEEREQHITIEILSR